MRTHEWQPISLWQGVRSPSGLPEVFAEFREYLTPAALQVFEEKAAREWSIESGQIEGAFNIDRGISVSMIEEGFNSSLISKQANGLSREQVTAILVDTKVALDGLFAFIKSNEPLTTSYIRQLHQQLMKNVDTYDAYSSQGSVVKLPLDKGQYKIQPNNPSRAGEIAHVYCPPEQVPGQMEDLIRLFGSLDSIGSPPEVRAAWLHHAFTQIHPFQDGNGRVARILASLVLVKAGLPAFTVTRDMHTRYIRSLEAADGGRPQALMHFLESATYRQVVGVWRQLEVSPPADPLPSATWKEIIAAAQAKLTARHSLLPAAWGVANDSLRQLHDLALRELSILAIELTVSLQQIDSGFSAQMGDTNYPPGVLSVAQTECWGKQAIDASDARTDTAIITIKAGFDAEILITFDPLSSRRKGLVGAVIAYKQNNEITSLEPAFFHHFKNPAPEAEFESWLAAGLKKALFLWQSRLG